MYSKLQYKCHIIPILFDAYKKVATLILTLGGNT